MPEAVILAAIRTPVGRYASALAAERPDDLAALVIREAVERAGVPAGEIEDVYFGAANQAGEDNRNVARMAALLAGLPQEVAGVTVNRLCASGLSAVVSACHAIRAGDGELFVAGGAESMTRAPFVTAKAERPYPRGPWGAKGVGELPMDVPAPAVAAAIFHATGLLFPDLPILPEAISAAVLARPRARRQSPAPAVRRTAVPATHRRAS